MPSVSFTRGRLPCVLRAQLRVLGMAGIPRAVCVDSIAVCARVGVDRRSIGYSSRYLGTKLGAVTEDTATHYLYLEAPCSISLSRFEDQYEHLVVLTFCFLDQV